MNTTQVQIRGAVPPSAHPLSHPCHNDSEPSTKKKPRVQGDNAVAHLVNLQHAGRAQRKPPPALRFGPQRPCFCLLPDPQHTGPLPLLLPSFGPRPIRRGLVIRRSASAPSPGLSLEGGHSDPPFRILVFKNQQNPKNEINFLLYL